MCAEESSTCGGSLVFAVVTAGDASSWSGDGYSLGYNSTNSPEKIGVKDDARKKTPGN
jgi:hypothetical protein